jgi:hypothetical protein
MVIFLNVLISFCRSSGNLSEKLKRSEKCTKGYYNDFGIPYKQEIYKFYFFWELCEVRNRGDTSKAARGGEGGAPTAPERDVPCVSSVVPLWLNSCHHDDTQDTTPVELFEQGRVHPTTVFISSRLS